MNPHDLIEEELDYELLVRKINGVEGMDNKRRALRRVLKDLRRSGSASGTTLIAQPESDLDNIVPVVESLKSDLEEAVRSNQVSKLPIIHSRFLHYLKRLENLSKVRDKMEIYRYCSETVNAALDELSKCRHLKKKINLEESTNLLLPIPTDFLNLPASAGQGGITRTSSVKSLLADPPALNREDAFELEKAKQTIENLSRKLNSLEMGNNITNVNTNVHLLESSTDSDNESIVQQHYEPNYRRDPVQRHIEHRRYEHRRHRLPVSKWALKFTGKVGDQKLNDFLNQVGILATAEEISNHELLRSAIYLFEDRAKTWYMAFGRNFRTWGELVEGLKLEFLPHDYQYWHKKDIENRLQKQSESFGMYLAHMELMFNALPAIPEHEKIDILMRNILPFYAEKLSLITIDSVRHLSSVCKQIEATKFRIENRASSSKNEVSFAPISKMTRPNSPGKLYTPPQQRNFIPDREVLLRCFNCLAEGHHFNQCKEERRVFCFKCGKQGVPFPDCTRCENMRKGGNM